MGFLTQLFNQLKEVLKAMGPAQKAVFALVCLGVVGTIVALVAVTSGTDMVPLTPESMNYQQVYETQKYLEEKRTEMTIKDGRIYVPTESRSKLLIELYGEGIMPEGKDFWDWTFGDSFLEGKDQRALKTQVSKKRELRRYLMMLPFVQTASVLEEIAEKEGTLTMAKPSSASIMLTLKSGHKLSQANVNAISKMVSTAFFNMDPKNVSIVADGTLYNVQDKDDVGAVATTHLEAKRNEEKLIEDKIRSFFAPFFPVVVKVHLTMDFTKTKRHTEKPLAMEVDTKTSKMSEPVFGADNGGTPGIFEKGGAMPGGGGPLSMTNPGTTGYAVKTVSESSTKSDIVVTEVAESELPVGVVTDTSVAIVVPFDKAVIPPNGKAGEENADEKVVFADNTKVWRTNIARICGISDEEKISITAMIFPKPELEPPPSTGEIANDFLTKYGTQVALLGVLLMLLFVGYRFVARRSMSDQMMQEIDKVRREFDTKEEELESIEEGPQVDMKNAQRGEWIKDTVKKNPRVAANLIKRWMKS